MAMSDNSYTDTFKSASTVISTVLPENKKPVAEDKTVIGISVVSIVAIIAFAGIIYYLFIKR